MFSKYTVLFAEDFSGQYSGLAESLQAYDIKTIFCKNDSIEIQVNLMSFKPVIIVFNSEFIGFDAVKDIASHCCTDEYKPVLYNIFTYGDDELVQRMKSIGIKINIASPYNTDAISSHLKVTCENTPINENDFRKKIHQYICEILNELIISQRSIGHDYITDCIMYVLFNRPRKINLNGKIYSEIAKQKNVSVESIEHAIRLAINSCWKKANEKTKLKYFAQCCYISKKPTNSELIISISDYIYNDFREYFDKYYRTLRY